MKYIVKFTQSVMRFFANALMFGYFISWISLATVVDLVSKASDLARANAIRENSSLELVRSIEAISSCTLLFYGRYYSLGSGLIVAFFSILFFFFSTLEPRTPK